MHTPGITSRTVRVQLRHWLFMHCAPSYAPHDMASLKTLLCFRNKFHYTEPQLHHKHSSGMHKQLEQSSRNLFPEKCMCKNETFCIFRRSPSTTFCERKPSHSPKKLSDLWQSCTMNACTEKCTKCFFKTCITRV